MKNFTVFLLLFCLLASLGFALKDNGGMSFTKYELKLPKGVPPPIIPADNELSEERVLLGKMLFYDKILSSDKSISCASCHDPEKSFGDNRSFSLGVNDSVAERNTMPLINLAWSNSFFWDGGVPTLELQVLKPLTEHNEMNMTTEEVVKRLTKSKTYPKLFMKAYGSKPDAGTLVKALACFERTLISFDSKYDNWIRNNGAGFETSEVRGFYLFVGGKTHCVSCHSGINFTNNSFQNNGLSVAYADEGRFRITSDQNDKGKFKVPTLRNIALTAPYMHDGSLQTLEDVVEHYNSGGKAHPNKSPHVHNNDSPPLTEKEKVDLIGFLKTLTDEKFINNPAFKPEAKK
jgi:cytochrome c peroxidase